VLVPAAGSVEDVHAAVMAEVQPFL
jgi:hypothetical protein